MYKATTLVEKQILITHTLSVESETFICGNRPSFHSKLLDTAIIPVCLCEPKEHESSSSQVPFLLFSSSVCFVFVLIKRYDRDPCFHNDVPTDVRSIKHERDIIVNAIARIHCW